MQKYRKIRKLEPAEFRRLTGVRPETFQEMVAILQDAEAKRMSKGGKRPRVLAVPQVFCPRYAFTGGRGA